MVSVETLDKFFNAMGYAGMGMAIIMFLLIGLNCVWVDHQTITITVEEKYPLYIISQNGMTYNVVLSMDYAKMKEGKSYEVAVAHNPYIGIGRMNPDGTWNIDKVIREVV